MTHIRRFLRDHALLILSLCLSVGAGLLLAGPPASAQVPAGNFVQRQALATAVTASGAQPAVRNANLPKTYQVVASTGSGTGTAVVAVQGTNDAANWNTIGTATLTLSTTAASDSFSSNDRYLFVRVNASTLTGTTATYTATMGF